MCNSSYVGAANADEEEPALTSDSPAEPDEFDPGQLRSAILQSFGKLVLQACQRMGEAQEKSTFRTNDDGKTTLALVRLAPGLLQLLAEEEKTKANKPPVPKDCPECFICSAPAGKHWAHECPRLDPDDDGEVLFDYKTRSLYHRNDIGQPFPRTLVPIGKNVQEWLEHNRVSERQYAASVDLRRMKKDAERVLHAANCAVASAGHGNFIDAKVSAECAKHVAEKTLEMLQHCNDRFNPFLPDPHPTPSTPKEDSDDVRSQPRRVDDPSDP